MRIVAHYSLKNGKEFIEAKFGQSLAEIESVVSGVDALACKSKVSREECEYVYGAFLDGYAAPRKTAGKPFRDMDFVKPGAPLGVEVQFGKYAFMVYNVCAKMTIFRNLGVIEAGVEIVPVKHLADEMSSGVSYFEQIAWDLEKRGVADIDVPVLVLGIDV